MIVFVVPFLWLPESQRITTQIPRDLGPQCAAWCVQGCLARLQAFKPGSEACIQCFVMQFEPVNEQVRTHVSPFVPSTAHDLRMRTVQSSECSGMLLYVTA